MVRFINFKNFLILFFAFVVYTMLIPLQTNALTLTQEVSVVPYWSQFNFTRDSSWKELYLSQGYYKQVINATEYTQITLQGFTLLNRPLFDQYYYADWYEIHFAFSGIKPDLYTTTLDQTVCDQYSLYEDVSIGGVPRDTYACTNQWDNIVGSIPTEMYNQYNPASMIVQATYNTGQGAMCIVNTDTMSILCPTKRVSSNAINKIVITFPFSKDTTTSNNSFWFVIGRYMNMYTNASSGGTDYTQQITGIQNSLDNVDSSIQDVNNSVNDLNDTINSDSTPTNSEVSGKFGDFDDFLPSNNTISSLISMPITLFQNVLNSINSSCSSFNLGSLLGTNLTLPCINISSYLGSNLWSVIDILFSGLFVFAMSKKFIKVFENFSTLKEGDVLSD